MTRTCRCPPNSSRRGWGPGACKQLAQSAGLTQTATAGALAGLLPTVIDRLTPTGSLPQSGQLPQLLASVKTMLGA